MKLIASRSNRKEPGWEGVRRIPMSWRLAARTPESHALAEESFASQEQTPCHPPPPAVPGDRSLSTASSSHPHRESGGKSLVDAISCLKASQFMERMGHQVTTMVSFEPKGLGFALLFGWGERTWQSQGGENQRSVAGMLPAPSPPSLARSRICPKSTSKLLASCSQGWCTPGTSTKPRGVQRGWEKEAHQAGDRFAHSTIITDAQHPQHHWLSGGDVEFHTQNSITSVKKA